VPALKKEEGRREHDEEKEEDREKYSKTQHKLRIRD